ncbi:hypothetical protein, partial [Leucobacter celer]|uniref:hypothetical protein n=1 Tax=Leucobacter celer TaxID=668625 RepID=UPI0019D381AC
MQATQATRRFQEKRRPLTFITVTTPPLQLDITVIERMQSEPELGPPHERCRPARPKIPGTITGTLRCVRF